MPAEALTPGTVLGQCTQAVIDALQGYGLDTEAITSLCNPEEGEGCSGVQECLNTYLLSQTGALKEAADNVATGLNVSFLLFSGYLVFIMQLGFAALCAGSIRSKNCQNILLKNTLDACVGAFGFYLFGYAFAFGLKPGTDGNGFIGNWNFALSYTSQTSSSGEEFTTFGWHMFFFQWSFCAATTSIVSGAVAERCNFFAYLLYSFFLSSFVYPVLVHWVWDPRGWLCAFNIAWDGYASILKVGAIDFAGSGVVHMTGGFAGLMGAWIIGPRLGRFSSDGTVNEMKGHSPTLVVMGTFLLWFGWFGFNPGSYLTIATTAAATIVSRIAVCTALAGGAGGVFTLVSTYLATRSVDTVATCNGVLAGLVAVTSACAVIEPWAAIIAGGAGAVLFVWADHLVLHVMKIDDPVSVFPLHGLVGIFGVLFPGLLAKPDYIVEVYGGANWAATAKEGHRYGIFYGGHGQILLANFVEILAIIGWTCFMMGTFFFALNKAGLLRVSLETELAGLDVAKDRSRGKVRQASRTVSGDVSSECEKQIVP